MTERWDGLPDAPGEHRSTGVQRAWCLDCQEWCYRAEDMHCQCCEDVSADPPIRVARSVLMRWAQAVHDEVGLDSVVNEIGAILSRYRTATSATNDEMVRYRQALLDPLHGPIVAAYNKVQPWQE